MKRLIFAAALLLQSCTVSVVDKRLTREEVAAVVKAHADELKTHAAILGVIGEYFAELEAKKVIPPFSKREKK
jgi:hypothetical protein